MRTRVHPARLARAFSVAVVVAGMAAARAIEPDITGPQFKLTASHYANGDRPVGVDLNLRASQGRQVAWIGHYAQDEGMAGPAFRQTRAGYETTLPTAFGQVTTSIQAASGGFWGGSLTAQIGRPDLYGIVGWGRTNLKPYYNLNFDPNDAVTLGVGARLPDRALLSVFVVRDDRLSTGQTVVHGVWRKELGDDRRLTVDVGRRQGRADRHSEPVRGHLISVGYDHRDLFVRVTRDRKVNFSTTDQTRVAAGIRF